MARKMPSLLYGLPTSGPRCLQAYKPPPKPSPRLIIYVLFPVDYRTWAGSQGEREREGGRAKKGQRQREREREGEDWFVSLEPHDRFNLHCIQCCDPASWGQTKLGRPASLNNFSNVLTLVRKHCNDADEDYARIMKSKPSAAIHAFR